MLCAKETKCPFAFFYVVASMTIKEVGFSDTVLETLAQCFSRSPCEVKVFTSFSRVGNHSATLFVSDL